MTKTTIAAALCAIYLAGCTANAANSNLVELDAFAKAALTKIQRKSLKTGRELCGLIIKDRRSGALKLAPPNEGRGDSCTMTVTENAVASYHTHGTHSAKYDSEVPSTIDIEGDVAEGTYGYISTPGGRFWRINPKTGIAELLCGLGCLPMDPKYNERDVAVVKSRYTIAQIDKR